MQSESPLRIGVQVVCEKSSKRRRDPGMLSKVVVRPEIE